MKRCIASGVNTHCSVRPVVAKHTHMFMYFALERGQAPEMPLRRYESLCHLMKYVCYETLRRVVEINAILGGRYTPLHISFTSDPSPPRAPLDS